MKPWVLWTGRIVIVGVGLLLVGSQAARALESTTVLGAVAGWLMAAGLLGIFIGTAVGLADTWQQLGSTTSTPGGWRGRRRANRQIDGKEPFRADDIAYLRWIAEQRAKDRLTPMTWLTFLSLISFTTGFALSPTGVTATSSDDQGWVVFLAAGLQFIVPVLRALAGVMALLLVAALLAVWFLRNDVKARAFLERTESIPESTWPDPRNPGGAP